MNGGMKHLTPALSPLASLYPKANAEREKRAWRPRRAAPRTGAPSTVSARFKMRIQRAETVLGAPIARFMGSMREFSGNSLPIGFPVP